MVGIPRSSLLRVPSSLQGLANTSTDQPWDDDTKKLVAFLFGVSIHYVSDELFEGLRSPISCCMPTPCDGAAAAAVVAR